MNGLLSNGLSLFPQTQHIHPHPKNKTYLTIFPPPAVFLNQNSSSFYTENYCLMFTGMRYRTFATTDFNGPLYPTWTTEQFKLKSSELNKKKKGKEGKTNLDIRLVFVMTEMRKKTKQEDISIPMLVWLPLNRQPYSLVVKHQENRETTGPLYKKAAWFKKKKLGALRMSISSSAQ